MADETLFELLHSEIVNYALENNDVKYKESKEEDLSTIEYIGFSTGFRIIESSNEHDELSVHSRISKVWTCLRAELKAPKRFPKLVSKSELLKRIYCSPNYSVDEKKVSLCCSKHLCRLRHVEGILWHFYGLLWDFYVLVRETSTAIYPSLVTLDPPSPYVQPKIPLGRLTKDMPRFKDELDTMKFICTDFWSAVYKKQIDNLRTNHQGVYVLQDNAFRFVTKLSNGKQYLEAAPRYVAFTCGIIRGSLANLNINCLVTAEVQNMPSCKFHIQVQRS